MPNPPPHPTLVSLTEAARRLSISLRSVRNLIRDGRLPFVRVTPRRVAIAEVDLRAYVAARRTAATSTRS